MKNSVQQKMFKGIRRWQQSGLTQKAWCRKNNIAYATFHYWYKRYRLGDVPTDNRTPEGFVQLMVDDSNPAGCWCELALPGGRKLVFHQPVSVEFLKRLLD